jgi:hypothetical protein
MAFGAPTGGQLSYSTVAPPSVQAAQAAAAAPQANADAAQKLAEAKAGTQVAQEQGVEAATKKQDIASANLYKTASMPGIENSAGGLKLLKAAADAAGVEIPKTVNGLPDVAALKKMSAIPAKPISQWTPQEIVAAKALSKEDRAAILPDDAPDSLRNSEAQTPITEKGQEALMKPVQAAETAIGKGTGNLQALQVAALSAYKTLKAKGGDTSVVDPYLNADHTALSDEFKNQAAGQLVDAQMNNLHSLGIFRTNETDLRQKSIDEKRREWGTESANVKAQQTTAGMRLQQQAAQFSSNLSIKQQNLTARLSSITNSANANTLRAGTLGMNMFENQVKDAEKVQQDAENDLNKVRTNINSYLNTPNADVSNPIYIGLAQQATGLNDAINGNAAKGITGSKTVLQAARQSANIGIANIYSGITGQTASPTNVNVNVTTPGAAPGTKYGSNSGNSQYKKGSAVPDAPGYTFNGVTRPNGDLEAVGPDGKIRPWNSH